MADIAYNPSFPARTAILADDKKLKLNRLADKFRLRDLLLEPQAYESCAVAYAFVSARIEGCRYSRAQAADLLIRGITAQSLPAEDTTMLANVHTAFLEVTCGTGRMQVLTKPFLRGIHAIISKDLLIRELQGAVRDFPVSIGGSGYRPLAGALPLDLELERILKIARSITDPFERCIYAHLNLAYLQYFADGNKRTARIMQTAVLANGDLPPLLLTEDEIPCYIEALVRYYETGDPSGYAALFCRAYEDTLAVLSGSEGDPASGRFKLLEAMI